mmetsp:Transcript_38457/g.63727  ORF Transcript_38457/g.63727 Transcript_38457/m.63727 type:complete len:263 (+) Transcript_38457:84-872(+)
MQGELRTISARFPNADGIPDGDYTESCRGCKIIREGAALPAPPEQLSGSCPSSIPVVHEAKANTQSNKEDLYAALGIQRTASIKEIREAYRKQAKLWHPDKHTSSNEARAEASARFEQVKKAYELLGDEEKRGVYDATGETEWEIYSGNPILVCSHCQLSSGRLTMARIELAACEGGRITNQDGQLYCYDPPLPKNSKGIPKGSYQESCFGCTSTSEVLNCAVCVDDDGDRHEDAVILRGQCQSFGVSEDGTLFCEQDELLD